MLATTSSRFASTSRSSLIASTSTWTSRRLIQPSSRSFSLVSSTSSLPTETLGHSCSRNRTQPARLHQPGVRLFSHTPVARASSLSSTHPPGDKAVLVQYPTPESLRVRESELKQGEDEDDDIDIELVPLEEATLELTERAAEQLQRISQRENNPDAALRIAVESGGCHGYQYKMELAKKRQIDDYVFSHPTIRPSNIVVDAVSLSLLKGSLIDFATELIGSSFRVAENPQAKGSGCGCGVSWELKT
ncbi:hypothetical protein BC629DRAFT_1277540 [Irpex lacteus]|nr:hypothetical protein BC629DRAFT_1277540 [Irpex lacteus]